MTTSRRIPISFLLFAAMALLPSSAYTQTSSQQETLNRHVFDLKKNPNDNALRERIIKLVQTMKPAPEIPEEAERFMARGAAAVKGAKNEKDFQDAVAEFEKASLAAPWLPAAYYNLGLARDKAGKYGEAIRSLKLYLLAAPEASDAKTVRNLVYEIEYRQEKSAKAANSETILQRPASGKQEDVLRSLQGAVWVQIAPDGVRRYEITLSGDRLAAGCVAIKDDADTYIRKGERCIAWDEHYYGRLADARVDGFQIYGPRDARMSWKGEISPTGRTLKFYRPSPWYKQVVYEDIYYQE